MTRRTAARLAGFTFLFYIAVGITQLVIGRGASAGSGAAARLASIARHATQLRVNLLLGVVTFFTAMALAVALYAITRDEDHELAVLALCCRVAEGVLGVFSTMASLGLLWLATAAAPDAPDAASAGALAAYLLKVEGWLPIIGGTFFAVGSTIFSYLLLRGRMIPVALAWLGVAASALLVVALPARLVGLIHGPATNLVWAPMAAFEIPLGLLLLLKGVPASARDAHRGARINEHALSRS